VLVIESPSKSFSFSDTLAEKLALISMPIALAAFSFGVQLLVPVGFYISFVYTCWTNAFYIFNATVCG
jgi:hypothetical protein